MAAFRFLFICLKYSAFFIFQARDDANFASLVLCFFIGSIHQKYRHPSTGIRPSLRPPYPVRWRSRGLSLTIDAVRICAGNQWNHLMRPVGTEVGGEGVGHAVGY